MEEKYSGKQILIAGAIFLLVGYGFSQVIANNPNLEEPTATEEEMQGIWLNGYNKGTQDGVQFMQCLIQKNDDSIEAQQECAKQIAKQTSET